MKRHFLALFVAIFSASYALAQEQTLDPDIEMYRKISDELVDKDTHQVVTNFWHDNWFFLADVGTNAYWADLTKGGLNTRITPQFNVGLGKWFTPLFGAKLQFTGFTSRANKYCEGLYTGPDIFEDKNGEKYWKEKLYWWDIGIEAAFNITRAVKGFFNLDEFRNRHQWIVCFGIGATHHYKLKHSWDKANEWSGRAELQYKRFFSPEKAWSLDFKLRALLYETKYDGVYNHQQFDTNISFCIGATFYAKERGWKRVQNHVSIYYLDNSDELEQKDQQINELNNKINDLHNQIANSSKPDTIIVQGASLITFPYLVNFVIDRVEVVNRERVNLRYVADMMKATPDQKYLITGYADKYTGSVQHNIWLAKHRSLNVYDILVEEFGVPKSQLELDDKGGVDNIYYDDPQLSRSVIITKVGEQVESHE